MPALKRPKQHYPQVEVWWLDACEMDGGWRDKLDRIAPYVVMSVGFLVAQDREHIVLAMDAEGAEHNGRAQIPRGMVKKLKILRAKDK